MRAAILLLLLVTCRSPRPEVEERPGGPRIVLERGACKGSCPEYRVEVDEGGRLVYQGNGHVGVVGRREERLTPERVTEIARALVDAGMFRLDAPPFDECPQKETCRATFTLELQFEGRFRRLQVDEGNKCLDPEVLALAERVDRELGTERWVEAP